MEIDLAESGHLRPRVATRLKLSRAATCGHLPGAAACGRLRPFEPLAPTCLQSAGSHLRPLAATRGHLRALAATYLELAGAATCGHFLRTVWSGHLRPLPASRVAASGCNHALASEASCGHLLQRLLAANQAAASGCKRRRLAACW